MKKIEKNTCIKCLVEKNINEFDFRLDTKKFRNICKCCRKLRMSESYINNKEKYKTKNKNYYKENKESIRVTQQKWKNENIQKLKLYHRNYEKNREKIDEGFKLRKRISSRIKLSLKRAGIKKSLKTDSLLGCSPDECRKWLENKFTAGMSWDNYGEWHIDHIIPCISFDLTNKEQQKMCFHYTNLQPLWAIDNITKTIQ